MTSTINMWPTLARDFGFTLRDFRERLKISEDQLASQIGLNGPDGADAIKQFEYGVEIPHLNTFVLLAQALKVSPGALLAETLWRSTRGHLFDDSQAENYWAPCLFRLGHYGQFGAVSLERTALENFSAAFNKNVTVEYARKGSEPHFLAVYTQTGVLPIDPGEEIRQYRWVRRDDGDAS